MRSTQSMLPRAILFISIMFFLVTCKNEKSDSTPSVEENVKYTRFRGSYKSFNDKPELHLEAAKRKGITPMQSRCDTLKCIDKMLKMPMALDMYKIDRLKHSVPFLVEDASTLLVRIGMNFKDSLRRKNMPEYKLIVTSVTRTQEDVASLTKKNGNASENSAHCYGTTFDISWKRFEKIAPKGENDVSEDKLKLLLAQVLHDLRERGKCYVVHERKQACFHITVR